MHSCPPLPHITMEKSDFHSKYDRESLIGVRDEYGSMKSLIGQLSSKLTSVSSHIEKEFLSAYRVHMLSVQEELRSLKGQVVDAEMALNDDEEVSKLEHEVTWFSDEATRLKNQSNSMKKDMQHVVGRIEALREQRSYLDEQLKTTMKRSKILEAEMGLLSQSLAQSGQMLMHQSSSDVDIISRYGSSNSLRSDEKQQHQQQQSNSSSASHSGNNSYQGGRGHSTGALPTIGGSRSASVLPRATKHPAPADVLITKGRGGGGTKEMHTQKLSAIEELQALEYSRLNVELDLESALRSVFAEIIDRKVNAVTRTASSKSQGGKTWKIDAAAGGLTGLGLSHFSDTDRLSAIATFLGQPNNFKRIFECLSDELS